MKFLKGLGKFILFIIAIDCSILLVATNILYQTRDITSKFLSEEEIRKSISTINVLDLLKDENGNELEQVTEVKNQLVSAGVPIEVVDEFINSEPVKDVTSNAVTTAVNYIFYGEEIPVKLVESDQIIDFVETNMKVIVNELQNNNIPNSELLTEERQNLIISNMRDIAPQIEEKVEEVTDQLMEKIKSTDEYEQIEEARKDAQTAIDVIRFIYSDEVTMIFLVAFVVLSMLLIISRLSFYRWLKWLGMTSIITGSILYVINILIPMLLKYVNKVPYIFQGLFEFILNESQSLFVSKSIIYFVVGALLIIANIVIYVIKEKREDKKIDL